MLMARAWFVFIPRSSENVWRPNYNWLLEESGLARPRRRHKGEHWIRGRLSDMREPLIGTKRSRSFTTTVEEDEHEWGRTPRTTLMMLMELATFL